MEWKKDIHEKKDANHIIDSYNAACDVTKDYNWCEIQCIKEDKLRTIDDIHEEIFKKNLKNILEKKKEDKKVKLGFWRFIQSSNNSTL